MNPRINLTCFVSLFLYLLVGLEMASSDWLYGSRASELVG